MRMTRVLAGITTSVDGYITGPGDGPGKGLGEGGERLHHWVFGGPWTYHIMGGADVIRQALAAGLVDEFTLIVAPVVLGAAKRLFGGFDRDIELEQAGARQSAHATFIDYRVGQSL